MQPAGTKLQSTQNNRMRITYYCTRAHVRSLLEQTADRQLGGQKSMLQFRGLNPRPSIVKVSAWPLEPQSERKSLQRSVTN